MPSTIINASAGSGKTYQLAVAYLQALLQPLPDGSQPPPQNVLATTFTRAAASEILERVLRRLAMVVVSEDELKKLLSDINRPDLKRADLVRLLESVCKVLPQLQVGTIDGLFSRIVRVLGLDLAFPPTWTMADDSTATELALRAADGMLSGGDARTSRAQWRRYAQFKPGIRARAALVDLLENNRFSLIEADVAADDPDLSEPALLQLVEAEALVRFLDAVDLPMTKGKVPKPNASWVKAIDKIKTLLVENRPLISILKGHTLMRLLHVEGGTYYNAPISPSLRNALGPLAERAREDLRRLHEGRLPALTALSRRYHELRTVAAHGRGAYIFPEIEMAARILPEHLSSEDLYFRLDGKIQHLLLDEFQDTSLGQFRFLWPIIAEVRASGRMFFAVGDVKQSIYGWRGADRRLLDLLPEWLEREQKDPYLKHERIADNWRSSPAILQAVDQIFENLDRAACLNPDGFSDDKKLRTEAHRNAASSFISGYQKHVAKGANRFLAGRVRLLLTKDADDSDSEEEDAPNSEVETILQAVEEHRRQDPNREIAILCRRHKLMPSILAGLRTRHIPASGEGGNPVTDSAGVEVVLSMLTWLDHPGHTLARTHVKLSGVSAAFGFQESTSDDALLKQTRIRLMRGGLAPLISTWIRHPEFQQLGTMHDQVRCEQLIELARHWDAAGGGRLSAFVDATRAKRVDNPASSTVRVMTIHGAKGLEFEAVILADIEASGGGGDGPRLTVTMTTPEGLPKVTLLPNAEDAEFLGLQEEYAQYQQGKFEEDLSVLYVALTRAKSFLDVVLPTDDKVKSSLSAIIRERWGQQDSGVHTIAECAAITPVDPAPPAITMERDPGIWSAADGFVIPKFRPVPGRLDAITPSGQEGAGLIKLGLLLNINSATALERGTAVHALLSRIEWIDQLPKLKDWAGLIPNEEADPEICRTAARELHPRLSDPADPLSQIFDPKEWMEEWKSDGVVRLEVWRERRFAAVIGRELMNGSFDRVVLGFDEKGNLKRVDILDFKTDRLESDADREERRLHYQPQLDSYISAIAKLTGLALASIRASLVWINPRGE